MIIVSDYFDLGVELKNTQDMLLDTQLEKELYQDIQTLNPLRLVSEWVSGIPVISGLQNLFNIMFFNVGNTIPFYVSVFLDMFAIFSLYVVYTLVRSG